MEVSLSLHDLRAACTTHDYSTNFRNRLSSSSGTVVGGSWDRQTDTEIIQHGNYQPLTCKYHKNNCNVIYTECLKEKKLKTFRGISVSLGEHLRVSNNDEKRNSFPTS
jgi:hypothetical protein